MISLASLLKLKYDYIKGDLFAVSYIAPEHLFLQLTKNLSMLPCTFFSENFTNTKNKVGIFSQIPAVLLTRVLASLINRN